MKWDGYQFVLEHMANLAGTAPACLPQMEIAGKDLEVSWDGTACSIRASDLNALCRGIFLFLKHQHLSEYHILESRHFKWCGAMVDVSRCAVLKKEAVFRLLDRLAALGMNEFMLYTEDLYTLEDYPYFGYMRGRYTDADLREMDAYAQRLGIEMVPCIQTLAHLGAFLQWNESIPLRDQPTILLTDDEAALDLIRAEIRAMRENFSSRRIHIGMDEAASVGLGRYYLLNGPTDRFDLLSRHLERVVAICGEYGFEPMMWSDMFFRLGSKTQDYYDLDAEIPSRAIEALPEVELCYWDYEHTDRAHFARMIDRHVAMHRKTCFAGGIHTWHGFLPNVRMTDASMLPAMEACLEKGMDHVLATIWGDDGNETDVFLALSRLTIFSESCWMGEKATEEERARKGAWVSGLSPAASDAMGELFAGPIDRRTGKGLIYCDPLYPFLEYPEDTPEKLAKRAEDALRVLEHERECAEIRYARSVFRLVMAKQAYMEKIRSAYMQGARAEIQEDLPSLYAALDRAIEEQIETHRTLWERDFKRNGWELLAMRYGAVRERARDVFREAMQWGSGERARMEELDEAPLPAARKGGMQFFQTYTVPSHYL